MSKSSQTSRRVTVLLAEDDEPSRGLLVELLSALGYDVVSSVADGRSAVEEVVCLRPDAVLLDVRLPDMSGIEAAVGIASRVPGTAVVLYSGDPTVTLEEHELVATGAIALLPKPAPPPVLDATIRLAVTRARELSAARTDAQTAQRRLADRQVVEKARGIISAQTGFDEEKAYAFMRRVSQERSISLGEFARSILEQEERRRARSR